MEKDHDKIKEYFKVKFQFKIKKQGILKEWADELAARTLEEKKSVEGRAATKLCQQAADTLKGFFKLCSKRVFILDSFIIHYRKYLMIFETIC